MQTEFKVILSRKDTLVMIISCVIIETILIVLSFAKSVNVVLIIMSIAFLVPSYMVIVAPLVFEVQVSGSNISVRTRMGKRFNFSVSEITNVDSDIFTDKQMRPRYTITIYTATNKLRIHYRMNGYQEMAGYLLDKLDSGEIDQNAISTGCKRVLNDLRVNK